MVNELELFSFDFSLFTAPAQLLSCPNCGYQVYKAAPLISSSFSKSAMALGCGALLYLNYFKNDQFQSILHQVGSTLQYYGSSIVNLLQDSTKPEKLNSDHQENVFNVQNNCTNITTNQWLHCTGPLLDDSSDLSSLTFSSLNSLDFESPICPLVERRFSESEFTMPSLEWDLGDTPLAQETLCDDDGYHHFGGKRQAFIYNLKYNGVIDPEVLSQIIFNKDFDFKDRIYDGSNVRKHFDSLRHQLRRSSMNNIHRNCNSNLNSSTYRSNRDSAFFEEE